MKVQALALAQETEQYHFLAGELIHTAQAGSKIQLPRFWSHGNASQVGNAAVLNTKVTVEGVSCYTWAGNCLGHSWHMVNGNQCLVNTGVQPNPVELKRPGH